MFCILQEKEGKTTNLEAVAKENQFEIEGCNTDDIDMPDKLCWFIEPTGWLLKRHKYALFIFSPTNP